MQNKISEMKIFKKSLNVLVRDNIVPETMPKRQPHGRGPILITPYSRGQHRAATLGHGVASSGSKIPALGVTAPVCLVFSIFVFRRL